MGVLLYDLVEHEEVLVKDDNSLLLISWNRKGKFTLWRMQMPGGFYLNRKEEFVCGDLTKEDAKRFAKEKLKEAKRF